MGDVATGTVSDIFEHLSNIPDDKPAEKQPVEKLEEKGDEDLDLGEEPEESDEELEEEEEPADKIDLDEEGKEENELELAKIPSAKKIKEKYPNIFKEFPALEHI